MTKKIVWGSQYSSYLLFNISHISANHIFYVFGENLKPETLLITKQLLMEIAYNLT